MATKIVGAESKSQRSTSPGKTEDVIALADEDLGASDSESSSSLLDRGIAMLSAPKMSRRKVKAGSVHKTVHASMGTTCAREAIVPVKPKTGPRLITGLEPRHTSGASCGASGAMASGAKAPDAEKGDVVNPAETA